jgi:HK97 family phage major capsid protein
MSEYLKRQVEIRLNAWEEAKALLDVASAEKRDLTIEEQATYDRINTELDERAAVIEGLKKDAEREERLDKAVEGIERQVRESHPGVKTDSDVIRKLATGELRTALFAPETRDVYSSSTGAPVATSFYDQVIMKARYVGPMLETSTILNTNGGETLQIPSLSTYSAGTAFGQGSAIGESDPVFANFVSLSAYKYAFITQLSAELIQDSGVDLMGFLADQTANGLGYSINTALTTGTGGVMPTGIVSAAGSGITSGTSVSGVFTVQNCVDLVYSVDTAARQMPGTGWMMNASSIGKMRTLQSTGGYYIFSPAVSADQKDLLMGYPVYENPAMAATGTSAKSVLFGNLSSFMVRIAGGGIQLDRSDEYAFNQGLSTFRAQIRIDGNLVQSSHVKYFIGASS